MQDYRIIYPHDDGGIAIVIPAPGSTQAQVLQAVPSGKPYRIIEESDIPRDDAFRDAWTANFSTTDSVSIPDITVDFERAKEITKNRLRIERKPLLESLDTQYQRALETSSDTTTVVAEKNRLRDITLSVDDCTSLDELKNLHC